MTNHSLKSSMSIEINPNRQIVLDTETTGMNKFGLHYEGHCIIEIGAVEMLNRRLTGRTFHVYIKPDRPVDPEAVNVHGITDEMLKDKPPFAAIVQEFLEFIQGAELLIHNAPFDVGFIDYELAKLGKAVKTETLCKVTDTLQIARQMYPGKRNSLDALCDRLAIDNSKRTLHGALLDSEILADVYLAMTGGQTSLFDDNFMHEPLFAQSQTEQTSQKSYQLKCIAPDEQEQAAHQTYLTLINKKSGGKCLWDLLNADSQSVD